MYDNWLTLIAMLLLSAFFSGGEMAFLASNKLMVEINREKSPRLTKILDIFYRNSSQLIATILLGNNVTMVIFGLVFDDTFGPFLSAHLGSATLVLLLQTLLSTIVIIVTAEFLPKAIIQLNPSGMLKVLAVPLFLVYVLFYPVAALMQKMAAGLLRLLFRDMRGRRNEPLLLGRVDFDSLVNMQADQADEDSEVGLEARLMRNALDFSDIRVRDCFVPRTDMVAIADDESKEALHAKFISTGKSKVLVYHDSIDDIVGYVHVSEMFVGNRSIREMMQPIACVPETMRANMLLRQFTSQHKSIAIVVDEFGGTAGLITLEDVLEEIFGEINDEHDQNEYVEHRIDEGKFVFSGRMEVDYINEKYDLSLPLSEDYDTLAGLILAITQSIPTKGEVVETEHFTFRILAAGHATIDKVLLEVKR